MEALRIFHADEIIRNFYAYVEEYPIEQRTDQQKINLLRMLRSRCWAYIQHYPNPPTGDDYADMAEALSEVDNPL